jgi:hypothetical protein
MSQSTKTHTGELGRKHLAELYALAKNDSIV